MCWQTLPTPTRFSAGSRCWATTTAAMRSAWRPTAVCISAARARGNQVCSSNKTSPLTAASCLCASWIFLRPARRSQPLPPAAVRARTPRLITQGHRDQRQRRNHRHGAIHRNHRRVGHQHQSQHHRLVGGYRRHRLKIYRSTENNDWDGDANDQWVDGKVVAAPAITYDDDCAGDTTSLVPPTANTTGGKLAINTAGVSPTRRFEVLENTGAAPQMKIISDASNYSEVYVDATGDLSLKLTGSGGDDLILLDENLKICRRATLVRSPAPRPDSRFPAPAT